MNTRELSTISRDIDMSAILDYARITGDFNPIHVDPAFAATTAMGGVIAHGTLSMNLLWQLVSANFGIDACRGASIDIRFARPVRVGDRVTAGGVSRPDGGYDVWVRNQEGVAVIEGTMQPGEPQAYGEQGGRAP